MVQLKTTPAWELESERTSRERRLVDVGVVLAVWLVGAVIFFREQWEHGWKFMMGNDGDARLIVYLNEHWFQVFHGHGSWLNPQFFYPVKGLLGWSDTFFLYQVFYTPLRLVGCEPFLAMQITVVLLSLVGVAAFYALLRVGFGTSRLVAGIFAAVGTFSNALWLHAGSFQDTGVWLVPLVGLLGLLAWRSAGEGHTVRAGGFGFACGGLAVMLFFSTYYVSYFSILAAVVVLIVAVVVWQGRFVKAVVEGLRTRWVPVAAAAVAFAIGLWPLLVTYLPAQNAEPKANYAIAISYAGRLHDLVDIGAGNVVWSSAVHSVLPRTNYGSYELTYPPTPVTWVLAIGGAALCLWWLRSRRAARPPVARAAVVLAISAVIVAFIPLHTRYFTLWAVIYHLPGARAMRAIDRAEIVTNLVALLASAAAVTEIAAHVRTPAHRAPGPRRVATYLNALPRLGLLAGALVVLLAVEQINTTNTSQVNRRTQSALLSSVRPAPVACRSFYVVDTADPGLPFYESQLDAILISQKLSLPTINGYTAYNPPGWNLEEIGANDYLASVAGWVQMHPQVSVLCQLDLAHMTWSISQ